jgi:hypothetical protein
MFPLFHLHIRATGRQRSQRQLRLTSWFAIARELTHRDPLALTIAFETLYRSQSAPMNAVG